MRHYPSCDICGLPHWAAICPLRKLEEQRDPLGEMIRRQQYRARDQEWLKRKETWINLGSTQTARTSMGSKLLIAATLAGLALAGFRQVSAQTVHSTYLSWELSTVDHPLFQNVYRQVKCTGAFVRRAKPSNTVVDWTDTAVKSGLKYCYYVTVTANVNGVKTESGPSNTVEVTIP
jgi:hypothetical protein